MSQRSSCIDLIFTNQRDVSVNSGVLDSVNWERLLDKNDLNSQVITLNENILNVFQNYVPQ